MASTINGTSTGSGGLISTGDDSGILNIQTNETTAITVDASQRVAFVAGTAALPAITTTGDTNTGIYFPTADTIAFTEGGAESMRIDSSGNVGIGTSSPNARLEALSSTVGAEVSRFEGNYTGSGTVNLTNWRRSGGAVASVMRYNDANTDMEFGTTTSHSQAFITAGTERMRITSGGNVLIGKTTAGAGTAGFEYEGGAGALLITRASNPTALFNRQGSSGTNILFRFQDSDCGTISVNTGSTAYNTSSDYRLKDEVTPMSGGLDKVSALKPVTWKWKSTNEDGQGFIAHELAEVCPQAVHGEKDAVDENGKIVPQGIDTSFLVATLTAALQETKALIDTQAETINALTARIVALEGQ